MIKKSAFLLLLILSCIFKLTAQTFYVSGVASGGSKIFKISVTPTGLESTEIIGCSPYDSYFSIAMNKNNFYWLRNSEIYVADIAGNTMTNCRKLSSSTGLSNALTLGSDERLYYSSSFLFATHIKTGKTDILGPMNYSASGDMCFYKGELYMAAFQGIVKINVQEPIKSTVHIPLSNLNIYGIVSVSSGIRKNTVYGLSVTNGNQTDVIEFDMENRNVVRVVGTLPYTILDAASPVEDGSTLGIDFEKVDINQDCGSGVRANIDVITKPHIEDFIYTLNGVSNNTGKFTGISKGKYTLSITSPSDSYSTTVDVPEFALIKPNYTWKITNQLCEVPGDITFETSEQNSGYQIRYDQKLYPLNNKFSNLPAGKTYSFEILNKYGCKVDALNLEIPRSKCLIEFEQLQIEQQCDVFHRGMVTVKTKAHSLPYTYLLNGKESNASGVFKNLTPGRYQIKIISSEDEFETTAAIPDYKSLQPDFIVSKNNPSCALKGSINFNTVTGNGLYQIKYKTDIFPLNHSFTSLEVGKHHFVVLKDNSCLIDEYDVELSYEPCPIVINDIAITPECNVLGKGFVTVAVPPIPETYVFTLNHSITNNTGIFNMLDPGAYEIEIKASGGAPAELRTVLIPDYSLSKPFSIVNAKNPVCDLTGEISLTVGNQPGDFDIRYNGIVYPGNHVFNGLYEGSYRFSILKPNGCIVDEFDVILETEPCNDISYPNAFSPNSDHINDTFKPKDGSRAFNFQIQIFDRRGTIMFSSNKLYDAWNGDYQGGQAAVGTYFWIATFLTQENKKIVKNGTVTLIR